ncbi:MAG: CoA-binding protein [Thermodesulfobacteriota bacterium]|nr:CoA-binding protein [Thermodesulfobacteriota bacterium]
MGREIMADYRQKSRNNETGPSLNLLFNPKSIAIVGASNDLSRIGGLSIQFLQQHGYPGRIFPVNSKYREVFCLRCFPTLSSIPDPVDLVLVGIPRQHVFDAFKECADKRIPFITLFSAGYAEMSEAGRREQEELLRLSRQARIRVLGPNCIGFISPHESVAASFMSGLEMPRLITGSIALITQSGGVGNSLLTMAAEHSIGFSYLISTGNELDLEVSDFIEHFIADSKTKTIAILIEGLKDPTRFARAADKAMRENKPIVALKLGRSDIGRKAAASHTGSMAGIDAVYGGLFKQKGICQVSDLDELLGVANLFALHRAPNGNRVAILSSSGGVGALMADLAANSGLCLPSPSGLTRDHLRDLSPALASIANPMDLTTQFMNDDETIVRYLQVFAEDKNFDFLILVLTLSASGKMARVAERIAALAPSLSKPMAVCWPVGALDRQCFRLLENAGIPLFFQPARCMSAVGHFVRYGMFHRDRHI